MVTKRNVTSLLFYLSFGYDGFVSLTVLFPKFLTRQLRYVVFPRSAVTFFEADLSKYGPVVRAFSSRAFWLYVSPLLPLPPCGILWQCTSETRAIRNKKRCVNAAISMLSIWGGKGRGIPHPRPSFSHVEYRQIHDTRRRDFPANKEKVFKTVTFSHKQTGIRKMTTFREFQALFASCILLSKSTSFRARIIKG